MSRHEGVSCDSCLKGNFRGKRYKCLICYDYDLCASCYDAGATNTRHTTDHPMQCILTRMDFDLYYGGEAISIEQPQAFTCPFCGRMGFTETTLQEHVSSDHTDTSFEVVCPICAALPGGEPNHVTDDFASHLTLEHRSPRDLDEPSGSRHVRRVPHPSRGISGARSRRAHMQFSSSTGLSSLSPGGVSGSSGSANVGGSSARDSMDPITELLSQLSGARRSFQRATANLPQPNSQLHQLQMQLQLERQQAQATRQQMERLPRRQGQVTSSSANAAASAVASSGPSSNGTQSHYTMLLEPSPSPSTNVGSQFLLSRCTEPTLTESEQQFMESERVDRSLFVQEFIMSTLSESLPLNDDWEALSRKLGQIAQTPYDPPVNDKEVAASVNASSNSPLTNEVEAFDSKEGSTPPQSQVPLTSGLNNPCTASGGFTASNASGNASQSSQSPAQHQNSVQNVRPQVSSQQNHSSSASSSMSQQNPTGGHGRSGSRKSSGSNSRGRSSNGAFASINQVNQMGVPQQGIGGGARSGNSTGAAGSMRGANRDGLHLGQGMGRGVYRNNAGGGNNGARESAGATSPSSTRRKVPRQVDDRNKSSEPPPPH